MYASKYNLIFDARRNGSQVILNPLNGGMDFLDADAVYLLNHADDPEIVDAYPEFFRYSSERGYLYATATDEERRLEDVHAQSEAFYRSQPLRVEIYPTLLCNLRCTYCFQGHMAHESKAVVSPEVIDSMFDTIAEFQRMRGNSEPPLLTLFGGEPLLNWKVQREAVEKILDLGDKKGYRLAIITNGVELASYAELLSRYHFEFIQVTLDGPQPVHDKRRILANGSGSFRWIVEGIDRGLEKGLPIVTRVNVDGANVDELPTLARFILDKGWLDRGVAVGAAPVDEFVPETQWCAEQTKIQTLKRLLDVKREKPETAFISISYRLAEFFEHIVEQKKLPLPMFKYCPAIIGNQISLDYLGAMYVCC